MLLSATFQRGGEGSSVAAVQGGMDSTDGSAAAAVSAVRSAQLQQHTELRVPPFT